MNTEITEEQLDAATAAVRERRGEPTEPCREGHFECAPIAGGMCEGEAVSNEIANHTHSDEPHVGHWSRLGGTYWCDTCNSPYCELA